MTKESQKTITIIALALILAGVVAYAIVNGNNVNVLISKDGKMEFTANRGQSLIELLHEGLDQVEPAEGDTDEELNRKASEKMKLAGALRTRGYYNIHDRSLGDAIRDLNKEDPLSEELRSVLYNLEGPFALPGTLRGADSRMWLAISDLYDGLTAEPSNDSQLFATLYTNFIQQETIFSPFKHVVAATAEMRGEDETGVPQVYSCPDSFLTPGTIVLVRPLGNTSNIMEQFTVRKDPLRHPCTATSPFEVLSGSKLKLGFNKAAFDQLFPPPLAQPEQFLGGGNLSVVIYPRNTQPTRFVGVTQ